MIIYFRDPTPREPSGVLWVEVDSNDPDDFLPMGFWLSKDREFAEWGWEYMPKYFIPASQIYYFELTG